MKKFESAKFYRLVDRDGFINCSMSSILKNVFVAKYIESLENKFQVVVDNNNVKIITGNAPEFSKMRVLYQHEAQYFEEIIDDEVNLKQPNVPYTYNETQIKDTIKVALEDDAFFAAVKMLSAADAAHVLSLKFGNNA